MKIAVNQPRLEFIYQTEGL